MQKKLFTLYGELKRHTKTPETLSLLVLLALTLAFLVVNIFFASLFLKLLTVFAFLGVAVAAISGRLRLTRLKIEEKFKTHELQAISQNLKDGIILYDTNFKILRLNQAAEELFGLRAEELVGKYITPDLVKNPHFKVIAQVIFPSLAPVATQVSTGGWPQVADLELEDPTLKLRTTLNRVLDEKEQTIGFLKIVHNETREKEIVQSKSEFIAVAAHQLRTPLTAIEWSLEGLSKSLGEKPELKEIVDKSLELSRRMLKTVNDLLDTAKIEEGKFGYTFQNIELARFINQVLSQAKPVAEEYSIEINFDAPKKDYRLQIDPERLGIAFSNLLDNAIRYNTKNGSVTISLEELKDKPFIRIDITDTGIGIQPQEINKLFKKFYRGSNITKIEPNGSGLGLYIVKNIIRRHGGDVGVRSQLGRGSTFWFTLPLDPKFIPQKEIAEG